MTPATKKHQQLILLEPEKAAMLEKLSAETRIPKQVLFREAVDDLLAMNGRGTTTTVDAIRDALQKGLRIVLKCESLTEGQAVWQRKCYEAADAIEAALDAIGVKKG